MFENGAEPTGTLSTGERPVPARADIAVSALERQALVGCRHRCARNTTGSYPLFAGNNLLAWFTARQQIRTVSGAPPFDNAPSLQTFQALKSHPENGLPGLQPPTRIAVIADIPQRLLPKVQQVIGHERGNFDVLSRL